MATGFFTKELGGYTLNSLPEAGLYEYVYKNDELLLKLDQYGVQTCQIDPPTGVALLKREHREISSPFKFCFSVDGKTYDNFNAFSADKFSVDFLPFAATYNLVFGSVSVKTELFVPQKGRTFVASVTFTNLSDETKNIKIMPCVFPYVNELMMAPWDKPEWYMRTGYKEERYSVFTTARYSVAGKREERRRFSFVSDADFSSYELSEERLVYATKNFTEIPNSFSGKTVDDLYAFSQCFAGITSATLAPLEEKTIRNVFTASLYGEDEGALLSRDELFLCEKDVRKEKNALKEEFNKLFSVRSVKTKDEKFNAFVNGFLPLELKWVTALDRGWPTGMRGVRDASNDFEGFIDYDASSCRKIIENVFSKQRSDGWYPRQVPFGEGSNFDLREFVDAAGFFTEFVYDYLSATDDFGLLDEKFGYYDKEDFSERGIEHLKKGVDFLREKNGFGEHSLVKMRGGDWLDCLSSAGIKGKGESVMVSCQLVSASKYLAEILKLRREDYKIYEEFSEVMKKAINEAAYNESGFYNGVFTDDGEWIFSEKDPDGEKRVYVPTNSYAIISGVAEGKEKGIIEQVEKLETECGYKLFSEPFGVKSIEGIGKMGTGDFQPYFAENASVYNHGSQLFFVRALAAAGEFEKLYRVLNFAMPYDEKMHEESAICAAPYAITNCYHLVPSFYGRTGFSFLTGSVAMIERAIYNWMFGINFTLNALTVSPCVPKEFADATVKVNYGEKPLTVKYTGFGKIVFSAKMNGQEIAVTGGKIILPKMDIKNLDKIDLEISLGVKK